MIRVLCSIITFLFVISSMSAQSFWKSVVDQQILLKQDQERSIIPTHYSSFELDIAAFQKYLANTPSEYKKTGLKVDIPMPDGSLKSYTVSESPCMEAELQARYPHIRSYKGYNLQNKAENIRFDLGPKGFHGAIHSSSGSIYIDPFASNQKEYYICYYTKDHKIDTEGLNLSCGTDAASIQHNLPKDQIKLENEEFDLKGFNDADSVKMQVYKLALSCTGEWGARQGDTVDEVLADMNTSVNRLNLIFENDLSLRVILVNRNDELIWMDGETDPFEDPRTGGALLGRNTYVINNAIGQNNYDYGHIYTVGCTDVGGIARLESVCQNGYKGAGVTCHGSSNLNYVTVSIAAHEMGHQFGANHTFNNCGSNANSGTAYEPGSGSTIMSYAGLCGNNNIQSTNDDYYHGISLQEIYSYMRISTGKSCADFEDIQNTEPTINLNYERDYYIPVSTPFELEGSASDLEGDPLSYAWEQFNLGPTSNLGEPLDNAPAFRAYKPSDSRVRYFPRLDRILANVGHPTEVLPTVTRNMNFRFVVRDNHESGGTAVWEEVKFLATDEAGPFEVTSQNNFDDLTIGDPLQINWDVANTDGELVNCQKVDILMSINGGNLFDMVIAEDTPNDGSFEFYVPNTPTFQARFKVKASDNIFFDINNANQRILEPTEPTFIIEPEFGFAQICLPEAAIINIETSAFSGFNEQISFSLIGDLPEGSNYEFSKTEISPSESTQLTIEFPTDITSQTLELILEATGGEDATRQRVLILELISNDFTDLNVLEPLSGSEDIGVLPSFNWTPSEAADSYFFELSTTPEFGNTNIIEESGIEETELVSPVILQKSTLYYWRVRGVNDCGISTYGTVQTFHTEVQSCKIYGDDDIDIPITTAGSPTIEYDLDIFDEGIVKDINIGKLKGLHDQISDLKVSLVSPLGTEVVLFENKCGNLTNYDLGFDDDAPNDVRCPMTGGTIYKPKQSLSSFNGEEVLGEWILIIDDTRPGNGGNLQEFSMELCSNAIPDKPALVRNNRLELGPGETAMISEQNLFVEDPNNNPSELIFTIVTELNSGALLFDGNPVYPGDSFTQDDIFSGLLEYTHDDSDTQMDGFYFTVVDGEGGWIDQQWFEIVIDEAFSTAVDELNFVNDQLKMFPNPTYDILNLLFESESNTNISIEIFDLSGKLLKQEFCRSNLMTQLSLGHFSEGLYLVKASSENEIAIRKLILHR